MEKIVLKTSSSKLTDTQIEEIQNLDRIVGSWIDRTYGTEDRIDSSKHRSVSNTYDTVLPVVEAVLLLTTMIGVVMILIDFFW